jgi:hypothetical protein
MKHSEIEKNLIVYIDGSIDERRRCQVEEHLSECPRCSDKLAILADAWNNSSKYQKFEPSHFIWSKIEYSLNYPDQNFSSKTLLNNFSYVFKFSVAAIILIASVLLGNYIGDVPHFSSDPAPEAGENQHLVRNYHLDSFRSIPDESIGMTIYMTSDNRR